MAADRPRPPCGPKAVARFTLFVSCARGGQKPLAFARRLCYKRLGGATWGSHLGRVGGSSWARRVGWSELWRSPRISGAVTAANLVDVDGDGQVEVAAGADNGRVYLLSQVGRVLWEADLEELVRVLKGGDVDGDGRREVVAATWDVTAVGKGQLHLLDGDQRRWTVPVDGYINSLAVQDVDGDGRAEIIVGSEARLRGMVQVLDGAGAVTWQREFDQPVTAVAADAGPVLVGTRSGRVYRLAPDGTPTGEYTLGAEVLGFGEGLAATAEGRVYRLEQNGPSLVRELERAGEHLGPDPAVHG